jgi:hypothetical protein
LFYRCVVVPILGLGYDIFFRGFQKPAMSSDTPPDAPHHAPRKAAHASAHPSKRKVTLKAKHKKFLIELGIFIATAVVGALASYAVSLVDLYERNNVASGIEGRWESSSCTRTTGTHGDMVPDALSIEIGLWRGIHFRNLSRTGFQYMGTGDIVDQRYFFGKWHSTRAGATANGTFQFTISDQGNYMAGTFTGNDSAGNYIECWLLGRDKSDLAQAREFLSQQSLRASPKF